ncbi:DUF2809 domain-containing protein [Desulfobacterales bacterium HSG17]|nr:DUF2809 domain-containing protein [Desulfobacterales bacterium HSG17]
MKRNRIIYIVIVAGVIFLGLGTRSNLAGIPELIRLYGGDTLWALMVFLGFAILFPSCPTWKIAIMAVSFSFIIEISQLYHAPWLDRIRHTRIGGLILGFGFLWSDLICYTLGVSIGAGSETLVLKNKNLKKAVPD